VFRHGRAQRQGGEDRSCRGRSCRVSDYQAAAKIADYACASSSSPKPCCCLVAALGQSIVNIVSIPSDGSFTRNLRCSVGPSELFRGDRMVAVWNSLYRRQFYTSMRRLSGHCHPGEVPPATLSPTPIYALPSRRASPGHYHAHTQCLDGVVRRSPSHLSLAGANLNVSLRLKLYSRF
jgi:hypothetical protein